MKGKVLFMKTNRRKMTAVLSVLLVLAMVLSFASCGASGKDSEPGNNEGRPYDPMGGDKAEGGTAGETTDRKFSENPFVATAENAVSTISADVDTASYAYFRKLVNSGYGTASLRKIADSFRTEEFINYFRYEMEGPGGGTLFAVRKEIFTCPWRDSSVLLRMTLQADQAVSPEGNNLVFLIDVSGSMKAEDKLPLLQKAFSALTRNLTERDRISIVTYSGKEEVVLDGCTGDRQDTILEKINGLRAYGSTNGEAGLRRAYETAKKNFIEGGNNRIIMASDGDLNVGISSAEELKTFISGKRQEKIYLSVLGFGSGNYRDANMETLADNGNGVYYYIDGESEAEKVFGSDLTGTLYTVAEDVKLQLTFDPDLVASYRLIGYENRVLKEEDFTDDKKDAGEVGAGHQVTVCYELVLTERAREAETPWLTLAVNYKRPGEKTAVPPELYEIGAADVCGAADADQEFLCAVIETCMLLHESTYLPEGASFAGVLEALDVLDLSEYPDRAEFRELIRKLAGA